MEATAFRAFRRTPWIGVAKASSALVVKLEANVRLFGLRSP